MMLNRRDLVPVILLSLLVLLAGSACEELVDVEAVDANTAAVGGTTAEGSTPQVASASADGGSTSSPASVNLGEAGGGGGFLWKPTSESDGRLVVLLPPQYRGNVSSCYIANGSGGVIEEGGFAGDTHNGNRPHFRFNQSGGSYGSGIYVVARVSTGNVYWYIANGSSRTSY